MWRKSFTPKHTARPRTGGSSSTDGPYMTFVRIANATGLYYKVNINDHKWLKWWTMDAFICWQDRLISNLAINVIAVDWNKKKSNYSSSVPAWHTDAYFNTLPLVKSFLATAVDRHANHNTAINITQCKDLWSSLSQTGTYKIMHELSKIKTFEAELQPCKTAMHQNKRPKV